MTTIQVYYYDGTVLCFKDVHLYIAIIALLLSIAVVVPFPLLIFLISFRRFKVHTKQCTLIEDILNFIPTVNSAIHRCTKQRHQGDLSVVEWI